MVVETTRFGQLEVDPCRTITLQRGLIGFPPNQHFILIEHTNGGPFQWLQSLDDPLLAFVVVDPMLYFPDYNVEISDEDAAGLDIRSAQDAQVLTTVTIQPAAAQVTANLLGPIVIGVNSRKGAQVVLNGEQYSTRHAVPTPPRAEPARVLQTA
jgi:flagellar assembly factor FliW